MMAVSVSTDPELTLGKPELLFEGSYHGKPFMDGNLANYDVTADGQRFVMVEDVGGARGSIHVVLNWFEELKRLAPTN
jgi:hypothetical protein